MNMCERLCETPRIIAERVPDITVPGRNNHKTDSPFTPEGCMIRLVTIVALLTTSLHLGGCNAQEKNASES